MVKTDLAIDYGPLGAINYVVAFDEATGEFEKIMGKVLYPPEDLFLREIFYKIETNLDPESIASSLYHDPETSIVFDFGASGEKLASFVETLRERGLLRSEVVKEVLLMAVIEGLGGGSGSLSLPKIKQAFLRRLAKFERYKEYAEIAESHL